MSLSLAPLVGATGGATRRAVSYIKFARLPLSRGMAVATILVRFGHANKRTRRTASLVGGSDSQRKLFIQNKQKQVAGGPTRT